MHRWLDSKPNQMQGFYRGHYIQVNTQGFTSTGADQGLLDRGFKFTKESSVIVLCFVVRYFMSILVLQSS